MPAKPAFPEPAATLPGEADILATVVGNLADDTAKLVYADWLEEHDDPRGKLLRDSVTAFRAGKKLPPLKVAPKPWCELVGIPLLNKIQLSELTAQADKILALARPALTCKSTRTADAKIPVGASKLSGLPDLPPKAAWPVFQGEPLHFLAQFNLAELSKSLACRELPNTGLISIFSVYDEDEGNDDFPKGSWRLFYFPDTSKLARSLSDPGSTFRSCRLEFQETLSLPAWDSPWKKELGLGLDQSNWDVYQEQVAGFGSGQQILGYPSPIQGDMLGKKTVRHLLTLDSDDNAGWMWGDGGCLYFLIDEADLKAKRFDRVRMEMQCG
ncbi:MAG: hypothetical protein C0467_00105 [Planctomycetaceae bacterium]|nr:hypothetical protein [Planctomycetaceae bacterium]